jgi:hypothetical protein
MRRPHGACSTPRARAAGAAAPGRSAQTAAGPGRAQRGTQRAGEALQCAASGGEGPREQMCAGSRAQAVPPLLLFSPGALHAVARSALCMASLSHVRVSAFFGLGLPALSDKRRRRPGVREYVVGAAAGPHSRVRTRRAYVHTLPRAWHTPLNLTAVTLFIAAAVAASRHVFLQQRMQLALLCAAVCCVRTTAATCAGALRRRDGAETQSQGVAG